MNPAIIILIVMNRYIRRFREAGAINPGAAIIPAEHGIRQSPVFQKLVRRRILIPVNKERYYMDEEAAAVFRKRRQSIALILLLLVMAGLVISFLVTR